MHGLHSSVQKKGRLRPSFFLIQNDTGQVGQLFLEEFEHAEFTLFEGP